MYIFILIIVAAASCTVVHIIGLAITCMIAGAKVKEIDIFYGPKLFEYKFNDVEWIFRWVPLGGYVKNHDGFETLHPIKQSFAACGGCLALIIFSIIMIGTEHTFHSFINGFHQTYDFIAHPRSEAPDMLVQLWRLFMDNNYRICIGVLACKFAAFNLIPYPTLNGFAIMCGWIECIKRIPIKVRMILYTTGTIGLIMFMIEIIIAFISLL